MYLKVIEMITMMGQMMNRRRQIRLQIPGQYAELKLVGIGANVVRSSEGEVLVLDIGPDGLRFTTGLKFPLNRLIKVAVRMTITGIRFETEGFIVRRLATENMYEYGVMFDMSALHKSFLIRMLDHLYSQLRPDHRKIHEYYTYLSQRYLEEQRSKIDHTI